LSFVPGNVSAVLLSAGRSSRMGEFKPLLPFGPSTVVEHSIQHLQEAGIHDIVVVLGHRAPELKNHLQGLNLRFTINPNPERGMSTSIECGIRQLSPEAQAVLIALVDHPAVASDVIASLIQEWRAGEKLIIPEFEGRGGHPVLIDLCFKAELLSLNANSGLKGFFEQHRLDIRRLTVSCPFIARDLDTWDDYQALHREVFGVLPQSKSN
jgi:molybdenum cofactor cytidylyltransferase